MLHEIILHFKKSDSGFYQEEQVSRHAMHTGECPLCGSRHVKLSVLREGNISGASRKNWPFTCNETVLCNP